MFQRPPLDAFIESIWVYQNDPRPHALERILPTGVAQLIVNLKEDETWLYDPEAPHRLVATSASVLSGVHSRFQIIDTSEQEYVAGVAFKPGGTVPFMRMPAHEASNAAVLHAMWRPPGLHPAVNFALAAFDREPLTTTIAAVTTPSD